ncbi:MAG TPA: hypothetical protein VG897_18125 [Terriglobales bacterium]|nr:hypothetical protein [Terriglobales bacterium]
MSSNTLICIAVLIVLVAGSADRAGRRRCVCNAYFETVAVMISGLLMDSGASWR